MRSVSVLIFTAGIILWPGVSGANSFPQEETKTVWRLGNADAVWAVSKATGQVVGGWNTKTQEAYLLALEGRYHLEDKQSLVTGVESRDKVLTAKFLAGEQKLELVCANPKAPDLTISKRYWLRGNKLFQRIAFTTSSDALQFITYNTQAVFARAYRDGGYYMGGGDGGGPLVPAPDISAWQKVTAYRNTTKGMVLHQPKKGYGFAHIRTRLDDQFVWPWFTGAIASYVERKNVLHYTPDGWDMSLGTSKLSNTKETSYEQYVSIFSGDWQQFHTNEYLSLPEVQQAYQEIPPTPDWVSDVKIYAAGDIPRLRRIAQMTDEGNIMVMVHFGDSWGDYYVDRGLMGGEGGSITAEEARDVIQRIQAISPRIKVGIYMWNLSTTYNSRIYKKHPEWFRSTGKNGDPLSTFPGYVDNYAHLLSIPECYNELLSQFNLVLNYLGTDFIYLDDPKAINLIDWESGEYTRDDLSFKFHLDIKRLAAKHSPDTMVFFNNFCNPCGDFNFVEVYSELRANYWRHFAGMATIAETVLTAQPKSKIIPLYYVPPLAREYMNRVLALGWTPSLVYGDALERRAFIQAAYELGNCIVAPVRYNPDWKRIKDTNFESYAVQRNGDAGYLVSFISHEQKTQTVAVELELDSFKLDKTGRVFVWKYVIENAMEYKGCATESLARSAYRKTGWQLDRVTRRKLIYAGPYRKQLNLSVDMEPLLLHQLYITTRPVAVYSENSLAANYMFNQMPKVRLNGKADWQKGTVDYEINSSREEAEIVAFLPLANHRLDRIFLDGQRVAPEFVWEGDNLFPVIKVGKGRHTLHLAFSLTAATQPIVVKELSAAESLEGIRVSLPGFFKALLTVEKDGRILFNRMSTRADRHFVLPLAAARNEAGTYTIMCEAVVDARGRVQLVKSEPVSVNLSAALPDLGLDPESPPMIPRKQEILAVNRKIQGLNVLRAATLTTATLRGSLQPNLAAVEARAVPDELLLEAGTTRKIDLHTRGAAFAGLEIENLRKIKVKLSNTFHDAFHWRGKGRHVPTRPYSGNFAGIVVDYHAPEGYTKRVRFAVGVLHEQCTSRYPDYGKFTVADELRDLGGFLLKVPEKTFALDLQSYAPGNWDGQVWLSVGSDWVCADRRLKLQILAANDAVSGEFLRGINPKAFKEAYNKPKTILVPRSPGGIIIDGSPDEEMWGGAGQAEQFFLYGGEGISKAQTTAMLLYDDDNLYVTFTCMEPGRREPLIKGGAPWGDDEVEVWIDANGDGKTYRQIILNGANDKMEQAESGTHRIGATTAVHVVKGQCWKVEMKIPYQGLGVKPPKPGDTWRLSLCRGRPGGKGFNSELMVWAPLHEGGFKDLKNFGTLIFK